MDVVMRKGQQFTLPVKYAENPPNPLPLVVIPEVLAEMDGSKYGDIVTMGSKDNIAREWRTGIPIPWTQRFILTKP